MRGAQDGRGGRPGRGRVRRASRATARGVGAVGRTTIDHVDLALLVLAGLALSIAWPTMPATHVVDASMMPVLALMQVVPLALLRRWPFLGWALSAGGAVVYWAFIEQLPSWPMPWPVTHMLVLLTTVLVAAMLAAPVEVAVVAGGTAALFFLAMPEALKPWAVGALVIVVFGLLVRWLVLSRRQLARQSEATEVERARRAVVEERSRIARELHDVVAHHMSMVVVQAQSAPYRLPDLTPEARTEMARIESSARQALNEVRGVLGVLREERRRADTEPQPGLEQLPGMLEGSRAAGVELAWRLEVSPQECPAGTALVLHRILQESLTNATRHSPGARVEVTLTREDDQAVLVVRNSPPRRPEDVVAERSGGNGLAGMQARAEAVGGTFVAAASEDGGFVVRAVVPLVGRPQPAQLG